MIYDSNFIALNKHLIKNSSEILPRDKGKQREVIPEIIDEVIEIQ